jgi:hypothetical protein
VRTARRVWPLGLGIALWPLYVSFVWLLSRGNDWGFFDSVQYFLTLVPATVADVAAPAAAGVLAFVRSVPSDALIAGVRGALFWIVAVLAIPSVSVTMAYGPSSLALVGGIIGLGMVGPMALLTLVLILDVTTRVFYQPGWWILGVLLVLAAYLAYVIVGIRVVRKRFA